MENRHLKTNSRPHESGLGLNVIEATRLSREEFDRIAHVAREIRMLRSEVVRRSVGLGIDWLARVSGETSGQEKEPLRVRSGIAYRQ